MLRLRLLGPIELIVDGRPLELGGPRQRVVLAMLGLNANRVTPTEHLIDAVWDTAPPSTARGQIQISISGLRRLLADAGRPDAIKTRPPGYVLEIAHSELDSEVFAAEVRRATTCRDEGRLAEAADVLRDALALWRGPALADVHSRRVRHEGALLEEARSSALEERLRLDLALGRHEVIVGELRALVNEHPFNEKVYGLLMIALYRCGRQAEALEVARQARRTLADEMGLDPGHDLQALEQAILNHDPAIDLPAGDRTSDAGSGRQAPPAGSARSEQFIVPRQLPASIADFTGRESQLEEIRRVLTGPRDVSTAYAVRIVAISGRSGVGKSTLAVRVAHELADLFPDGHLYADLGHGEESIAAGLARFLRALGVGGALVPDDPQERMQMYRSRLADKRVLVLVDDVSSEAQVVPLLPGSPTCAVITTSRAALWGLPGAHWVHLDVLDADKSVELLAKIVGDDRVATERGALSELARFCDGLPLALRVAGARLASRPHWRVTGLVARLQDEARRLDELAHMGLHLRSSIGLTYRGLSQQGQRLFRRFALIKAPDFPAWTAAALLDTDLSQAEEVLESLVDAQLLGTVRIRAGEQPRYRFHDLIRVYASEQMSADETPAERRDALARVLGGWLGLAEAARRRDSGGDYTTLHGSAPRWYPQPRETVDEIIDPAGWWTRERQSLVSAIRQAADAGMDELCWDLTMTCMTLFEVRCYFDDWRETSQLALDLTRRAGNRTGSAAMVYMLGAMHLFQRRLDEAERCFGEALAIFREEGNAHGTGLTLRNMAFIARTHGQFTVMLASYTEALALVREVGDREAEAHILRNLAAYELESGRDIQRAQHLLEQSLAICEELPNPRGHAQVLYVFAELYLHTDRIEQARQALSRALPIVRDLGDPIGEAHVLYRLGVVQHRQGRLDVAVTTLTHALNLAEQIGEPMVAGLALYVLGEIALARGGHSTAKAHLAQATQRFDECGAHVWRAKSLILLSEVHSAEGNTELSDRTAEQAAAVLATVQSRESAELLAGLRRNAR